MTELVALAEDAYRRLVWEDPDFEEFFYRATPIGEISRMELGSRPARRAAASPSLASLRAIPWTFAWAQSRTNLPAWYGVGAALSGYVKQRGAAGREELATAYREWAFFSSIVDNVELGLAIADPVVASRYAGLAGTDEPMLRIAETLRAERARTEDEVLRLTGSARLLDRSPRLQRSVELRTPYVDVLSELQVRGLSQLRAPRSTRQSARPPSASCSSRSAAWRPDSSTPVDPIRHHGAAMNDAPQKTAIVTGAAAGSAARPWNGCLPPMARGRNRPKPGQHRRRRDAGGRRRR